MIVLSVLCSLAYSVFYFVPGTIKQSARIGWLVGCFGFNGPLRQYFSLYWTNPQREGERGEKGEKREMRVKMSKQPPPAHTASAAGP